jgi:hypothetical protein
VIGDPDGDGIRNVFSGADAKSDGVPAGGSACGTSQRLAAERFAVGLLAVSP